MKKGISIPINTLVMLAIAVIVLLAVTAWFMLVWTRQGESVDAQTRFQSCCQGYVAAGCPGEPSDWDCNIYPDEKDKYSGGTKPTLKQRANAAGIFDGDNIKKACGCPVSKFGE